MSEQTDPMLEKSSDSVPSKNEDSEEKVSYFKVPVSSYYLTLCLVREFTISTFHSYEINFRVNNKEI